VFRLSDYLDEVVQPLWSYWGLDARTPQEEETRKAHLQLRRYRAALRKFARSEADGAGRRGAPPLTEALPSTPPQGVADSATSTPSRGGHMLKESVVSGLAVMSLVLAPGSLATATPPASGRCPAPRSSIERFAFKLSAVQFGPAANGQVFSVAL